MLENKLDKKKDKKDTNSTIIIVCIIIGIIIASIYFMLNSNLFLIKGMKVINNNYFSKETIIKKTKIKKNINIFKINLKDIEKDLEKESFIKSVDINRKLPDTLEINLTERKKTFLLQYTSFYLTIDEEGIVLEHIESKDDKLPVIKGFNTESIKLGDNIFKKGENSELNIFISEAEKLKIISKMIEIDKDFSNDVTIEFKDGIVVAFGALDNVEYKLGILKEILDDVEEKEIKNGKIIMNKGDHPILIIDD